MFVFSEHQGDLYWCIVSWTLKNKIIGKRRHILLLEFTEQLSKCEWIILALCCNV